MNQVPRHVNRISKTNHVDCWAVDTAQFQWPKAAYFHICHPASVSFSYRPDLQSPLLQMCELLWHDV